MSEFCKEDKHNQAVCMNRDHLDMGNLSLSSNSDVRMDKEGRRNLDSGNGSLSLSPWMHAPKRGIKRVSKDNASDKHT